MSRHELLEIIRISKIESSVDLSFLCVLVLIAPRARPTVDFNPTPWKVKLIDRGQRLVAGHSFISQHSAVAQYLAWTFVFCFEFRRGNPLLFLSSCPSQQSDPPRCHTDTDSKSIPNTNRNWDARLSATGVRSLLCRARNVTLLLRHKKYPIATRVLVLLGWGHCRKKK